nr:transposon TX1 [Tanacetum cinerariifolium]
GDEDGKSDSDEGDDSDEEDEGMFKKIAALQGPSSAYIIVDNLIYGRVQILTSNKGLIKEEIGVVIKEKVYEVSVVEEMRDIIMLDLQDGKAKGDDERMIEAEEKEINDELMGRSVVGEVKARCFLTRLPFLSEEQGLGNIEVRFWGDLMLCW